MIYVVFFLNNIFSEEQDIRMSTCFCFCSDTGLWFPLGNDPDPMKLTHPSRRLSETGRKYRMRELYIWCRCAIWTSLLACLHHLLQFVFLKTFFKIWAKFPESWAFWQTKHRLEQKWRHQQQLWSLRPPKYEKNIDPSYVWALTCLSSSDFPKLLGQLRAEHVELRTRLQPLRQRYSGPGSAQRKAFKWTHSYFIWPLSVRAPAVETAFFFFFFF